MIYSMVNVPQSHLNCRLDNYDWGGGKKLLRDHLERFADDKRKGITFLGKPGVGKTHLMVATYVAIQERGYLPGSQVVYWDWMDLLTYLRQGFGFHIRADEAMMKLCATKFLLVDDIKPESVGTFWREMIELLIESTYNNNTKLIVSTNADGQEELISRWNLSDYHFSRIVSLTDIIILKGKDRRIE